MKNKRENSRLNNSLIALTHICLMSLVFHYQKFVMN